MWQYNSGLRTLDNKNGNWKYLHVHWTLPLKDENEKMHIETINGEVLGINNNNEIVLQNVTDHNPIQSKWTRSSGSDGFSTFCIQVDGSSSRKFLTANGKHNLTLEGMYIESYHLVVK